MERALEILVVDDDEVDVLAVRRAFAKANVTNPIHCVRDRDGALSLLRAHRKMIVLLALDAPRTAGIALLRALRDDTALRDTTVVVLTTSAEDRERVEALELGVAGYLQKPFTFGAFVELVIGLGKTWTLGEPPRAPSR
jgi:CheY-like chemotaxis protein